MTDALNPFGVPPFVDMPRRPLRPFESPEHGQYYVAIGDYEKRFNQFQERMRTDLDINLMQGRVVLVTGPSGCGKTALLNHCVSWWKKFVEAQREGMICDIIDATKAVDPYSPRAIDERIHSVFGMLVDKLRWCGALGSDAQVLEEIERGRRDPRLAYPSLGDKLESERCVSILLPQVELYQEVVKYAFCASKRVVFFMESSHVDDGTLKSIARDVKDHTTVVDMRLVRLRDGDTKTFIDDRLTRHESEGRYPRMSELAVREVARRAETVAQLQSCLHNTYQLLRRDDQLRYMDDNALVEPADVRAAINRDFGID